MWVQKKREHTLIFPLYEYSDTAVCDTEIAAGVLEPHRYTNAMPGQKLQHLGQDGLSRLWQAPESPRIPPVTPSTHGDKNKSIKTFSSHRQMNDGTLRMSVQ